MEILENVELAPLTTYKLGGRARWFAEPTSAEDLLALTPVEVPVLVLGRGSNVLIADAGFDGLVIRLASGLAEIEIDGLSVRAGGGASLATVARAAAKSDLGGLEWLVGVPGSVGGAVRMNAGCFGSETSEALIHAKLLDLSTGILDVRTPADLEMNYRSTNVQPHELVLEATFRVAPSSRSVSEGKMREITRWRKDHQPGGTFNAGSVFKNPPGDAAGRIIDALGLKGRAVGGVSVSHRHANFFVAEASASAQDMFDLVQVVKAEVMDATGIELVPEVQFAGFDQ